MIWLTLSRGLQHHNYNNDNDNHHHHHHHDNDDQADPEQRFTTFVKALQATRLDKEITDYDSE